MHHGNVATVTKQKAFNKAMITPFTEIIFIDEATDSTLDMDDWKILTQGGFSAHDVKYQTAKPFINRCPMLITSQRRLKIGPLDQPAMDRRLTTYEFKRLSNPDKNAAAWLKKHAMDCLVWAAEKARECGRFAADQEENDEERFHVEDGVLEEPEKEEIRSLHLDEVLNQRSCTNSDENSQDVPEVVPDDSDSSQDQAIAALRRVMDKSS